MGHKINCPKCGHRFDEGYGGLATRYTLGTAELIGKGTVHVGARVIGNTLGAFFGNAGCKVGGRAGALLAEGLVGNMNNTESSKIKCPRCGHKW